MPQNFWAHPHGLFFPLLWVVPVLYWVVLGWVLWKFYHAIDRIGGELTEIKAILRDRRDSTTAPSR